MKTPFWHRLVYNWCLNGRTGLTLPFIVGADARARNSPAKPEDARRLLDEMRVFDSPEGAPVLKWCPDRRVLVIGMNLFSHGRLTIDDSLTNDGPKEGKILEELAQVSAMRVRDGEFSILGEPPAWAPFDTDDLDFIDSVIKRT